jgi:hypothetical protein
MALALLGMTKSKPKQKPQPKKLPGKNPTDPMVLARSVVESAIGEPLIPRKKRSVKSKKK